MAGGVGGAQLRILISQFWYIEYERYSRSTTKGLNNH